MSFYDPERERKFRENFKKQYSVPEELKKYYDIIKEDERKRKEWRKKHPILAALFG